MSASHVTSTAVQLSDATGSTTSMLAAQSTKVSGGSVVHTGGAKSKNTGGAGGALVAAGVRGGVGAHDFRAGVAQPSTATLSFQLKVVSPPHASRTSGAGKASMLSPQDNGQNATAFNDGGVSSTWVWVGQFGQRRLCRLSG